MARIVGGLTTSHIPAIGNAVPREKELLNDPYWKPFFAGLSPGVGPGWKRRSPMWP